MEPVDCPKCGGDDIDVESSNSMQMSEVSCGDCGHKMQAKVCEEAIISRWNKVAASSGERGAAKDA